MWREELARATLAIDRAAAAAALAQRGGRAAEEALSTALLRDPFWAQRGAAATGLAQMRNTFARDHLIKRLRGEVHPRARRAIARALGEFVHDAEVGAALAKIVDKGDASYFVEAEACLALGKT